MLSNFRAPVFIFLSFLLVCSSAQTSRGQAAEPVKFSFRSLDGGDVTDAALRGKVVVLIFSASWLPITKGQAAAVHRLVDEFAPRGVIFYLVSTDSEKSGSKNYASDEAVREYAQKRGLQRLPVLRDPEGKSLRSYGRNQIPLVVVLDREGREDGKSLEGFGSEGSLETALRPRLTRPTQ